MIVREAMLEDFDKVMPLFREVFEHTPFSDNSDLDEKYIRRMFVVAINTPNFFCRVVERDGSVDGCMAGILSQNVWGSWVASDLFTFSRTGTHRLIREFLDWARERGASAVNLTNISGHPRYDKLITRLGLAPAGTTFLEIL